MRCVIDGREVPVRWEDNASVAEIRGLVPLTVGMSMYGGFEQVGDIGQAIVCADKPIHTSPGDIMLYAGEHIVVFYGTHSWQYTPLGHIDLPPHTLTELLANGDVVIELLED